MPGLFQTQAYARLILSAEPGVTPDEVDERVTGRGFIIAERQGSSFAAYVEGQPVAQAHSGSGEPE
ncbi:Scr1 family TA system antitoxin-like transcriptional regulator [Sphaerisporangium dianthi]|uniref:Scr1 family TA system antitoxin-like transcriptional regulator n=1 Tax=Sphaerisporangium dianthi TaxID=1436120 RepID=A0ABV9CK81_9ACTN